MRHRIALAVILAACVAAMVAAERKHVPAAASAQSVLYLVADSERDLVRMPANFTRVSDAAETKYGSELASAYLGQREKLTADDNTVEAYVHDVGTRVAARAKRKLNYQFHYLPERSFVNAFALPGGHVFIGAGLIEHMSAEDELAAVLAHEVEHVDHYHCAERMQTEAALRKIPLGEILQIPVAVFQAGYSKEQELEADREGVLLAANAGYSAQGAVQAFETIEKLANDKARAPRTPQEEAARVATGVFTGYFRSHPETPDRIAQIRALIARRPDLVARPMRGLAVRYVFVALQALDAAKEEKYDVALERAHAALADHPDHAVALQALFEANAGLGHLADAANAYRTLLVHNPKIADAAETWAELRISNLADAKRYEQEIALVEMLLELQPAQARLLRFAASAYSMTGNDAAATEKATMMLRLYPSDAHEWSRECESNASMFYGAHDFEHASSLARLALTLDPSATNASTTLGDAEFAQAHFANAANAYKDALDVQSSDAKWLRSFADALGAARPATAANELRALLSSKTLTSVNEADQRIELAGLALLANNDAPAREIDQLINNGTLAPEFLARLGWWYLRAHRAADAETVLRKASMLRPGDTAIRNALAWTLFEQAKPFDETDEATDDTILANTGDVRHALIAWQQRRKREALNAWTNVVQSKPQWANREWRDALYPPRTALAAQELEAERERITQTDRSGKQNSRTSGSGRAGT